jgi:hypothetical protein
MTSMLYNFYFVLWVTVEEIWKKKKNNRGILNVAASKSVVLNSCDTCTDKPTF